METCKVLHNLRSRRLTGEGAGGGGGKGEGLCLPNPFSFTPTALAKFFIAASFIHVLQLSTFLKRAGKKKTHNVLRLNLLASSQS